LNIIKSFPTRITGGFMKAWKVTGAVLICLMFILPVAACNNSNVESDRPINKVAAGLGDLMTRVNGSGKVVVLNDAKLSFGSSNSGKIESENVKEGDKVTKGAILAKLDTASLELNLSSARVAQSTAQLALTVAQSNQTQADIALASAKFSLDQTKAVSDIEDEITKAQMDLAAARIQSEEARIYSDSTALAYWTPRIQMMENKLAQKQHDLAVLLSKDEYYGQFLYLSGQQYDRLVVEAVRIKQLQVTAAQQSVQQTAQNVELAKQIMDQANKTIALAQKNIDDASILAPFDGKIATVYYRQGDVVPSALAAPQIIMYLVDTDNLEVDVSIDESAISAIQAGQSADINIDTLPGVTLTGRLSSISTIPNTQAGLVGTTAYIAKITFGVPQGLLVKPGMNAEVNIITSERKSVLLVPSEAVKKDIKGNTYVQVYKNENIQSQTVVTGVRNASNTEIVSGLAAGDMVVTGLSWSNRGK
jgi:HlyD family secretion protein